MRRLEAKGKINANPPVPRRAPSAPGFSFLSGVVNGATAEASDDIRCLPVWRSAVPSLPADAFCFVLFCFILLLF